GLFASPSRLAPPTTAVIPNGASRRFFLPTRSCKAVGLRREKSLFSSVYSPSCATITPPTVIRAWRLRRCSRSGRPGCLYREARLFLFLVGARYIVPVFSVAPGFRVWRLPRRFWSGRPGCLCGDDFAGRPGL